MNGLEPLEKDAARRALKPLSLFILGVGLFCLIPYLLMPLAYANRFTPIGTRWISSWGDRSFMAAMALFVLMWVWVPFSALWVYRVSGSHAAKMNTLGAGFKRCAGASLAVLAQLAAFVAAGDSPWVLAIPGAFGLFMTGYALWLLRRDRAAASS